MLVSGLDQQNFVDTNIQKRLQCCGLVGVIGIDVIPDANRWSRKPVNVSRAG
jgi:hypothetical protein